MVNEMDDAIKRTLDEYRNGKITSDDAFNNITTIIKSITEYLTFNNKLYSDFIHNELKEILQKNGENIEAKYKELFNSITSPTIPITKRGS